MFALIEILQPLSDNIDFELSCFCVSV
jgi:hypothetical protein